MAESKKPELEQEVVVTEAMIEAGVAEAKEFTLGENLSELVRQVYLAMALELT